MVNSIPSSSLRQFENRRNQITTTATSHRTTFRIPSTYFNPPMIYRFFFRLHKMLYKRFHVWRNISILIGLGVYKPFSDEEFLCVLHSSSRLQTANWSHKNPLPSIMMHSSEFRHWFWSESEMKSRSCRITVCCRPLTKHSFITFHNFILTFLFIFFRLITD